MWRRGVAVLILGLWVFILGGSPGGPAGGAGGFVLPSGAPVRWGLAAIHAPQAWQVTQGREDVVVAVIDSGIDRTIPALSDRMWTNPDEIPGNGIDDDKNGYIDDVYGWDFRDMDPDSLSGTPLNGHGTFVAGLIAAAFDATSGAGGVAPRVRIMDLRFLDSRGLFYTSDWRRLAAAVDYAVENGARVINMSIYAKLTPPGYVHAAIRRAVARGVLVVGITGNEGSDRVGYFGRWPEVLAVGAVDRYGRPASFSNRGPEVALAGPGVQVVSFSPGGELTTGSGTSFAAPHVAGTAALLLSLHPDLSQEELLELLLSTAVDVATPGPDGATGAGLVDAGAAVARAHP
ncbi:TPA: hypothetical protein DCL37_09225 [Candidatus Acetothermia bacterium]|nr:hypothetical protein [Candidatus Acetothermia bacterium]